MPEPPVREDLHPTTPEEASPAGPRAAAAAVADTDRLGLHPSARLHCHLVGAAGSGMRALAEVLWGWGWPLSGSDVEPGGLAEWSAARRVPLSEGHRGENLPLDTELVIASDAVPPDNPELWLARRRSVPRLSYYEALGRLTRRARVLAVAGTHGKSTTTAMAGWTLCRAGLDPTVFCGASLPGEPTGGRAGQHELVLSEACEYRANFLHLRPAQAVLLGIEPDHFDCYRSTAELEAAFGRFAARVPADGLVLVGHDCPQARRVGRGLKCRLESFGLAPAADWSAEPDGCVEGCYRFVLRRFGREVCRAGLRVPGLHNVANAAAAAALCLENGATPGQVAEGLATFPGLQRRLERVGTFGGIELIDDYAHHPTEIAASLGAVRGMFPRRRLWCVYQPHQASRTAHLLDGLAAALRLADRVVLSHIYRAREGPARPGEPTAAALAERLGGRASGPYDLAEIAAGLPRWVGPGDVLVTMGAGDIRKVRDGFVDRFREDRAAG